MPKHHSQRKAVRPVVEGLESRELLSGGIHSAARRTPPPILANLGAATTVSTVPSNGDQNPYGVAFVPSGFPGNSPLHPGNMLVSNFNNGQNQQGTGTTIVSVTPAGNVSTFYQNPNTPGLSTALAVLKSGYVLVGNVPAPDGTSATLQQGSLTLLDRNGNVVTSIANASLLNGPWDMTVLDQGRSATVFVSNVLSGTVSRFTVNFTHSKTNPVVVRSAVQIASGFPHRTDPNALVLGPAGLAYDPKHDILYVASQVDNSIYVINHAARTKIDNGTGTLLVQDTTHLHGPTGLVLAPNGNLIVANGDGTNVDPNQPSELVEYTPAGAFVDQKSIDSTPGGAFGLAISPFRNLPVLAAVDDITGSLDVFPINK